MGECNCNETFRTAEDYRDHLPCEAARPAFEIKTMWMTGHTDGYVHTHNPPFYRSAAAAQMDGVRRDGAYSVPPKSCEVIELSDGRIYKIEGPYKSIDMIREEKMLRKVALSKLTLAEQQLLGVKDEDL
jgi:hypothetical protein